MRPGDLRHIVSIRRFSETEGANGQAVKVAVWHTQRDHMNVKELIGQELSNAKSTQPEIAFSVSRRWSDGVTSKMELVWHDRMGDRTLAILSPPMNPDGRKREMILMCKELK